MAGEWLKFECSLPEKPETLAITIAMGWDDPDLTVGKLMRLFRWFDQQTIDGNAPRVSAALLDRIIGVSGFVTAVADVGWIVISGTSISLANFDRHNGATAKSRALTAKRVANHKANASGNASGNDTGVSEALAREEKRREEKKEPKSKAEPATPAALPDLFAGIDQQIVADFKAMRKTQKAPITQTAIDGIQREADKAGISLADALTMCCERSWRGFKAEWMGQPARASPPSYQTANDKAKTLADRLTGKANEQRHEIIDIN